MNSENNQVFEYQLLGRLKDDCEYFLNYGDKNLKILWALNVNDQIEKMKENLIKKIVSGVFAQIPNEIDYMGIRVKPHTLMNKSKLKEAVEKLVIDQQILDLVTKLTNYKFVSKYGDYYIWKKAN